MVISALAGGAVVPPVIGAVGAVCTVGTSVYEHWDDITEFFTGEEVESQGLSQILPSGGKAEETSAKAFLEATENHKKAAETFARTTKTFERTEESFKQALEKIDRLMESKAPTN